MVSLFPPLSVLPSHLCAYQEGKGLWTVVLQDSPEFLPNLFSLLLQGDPDLATQVP